MKPLIELNSVSKTYQSSRESVKALIEINLKLNQGDYVSIVGPSGAGKSTLLHIIGGLDAPSRGSVLFRDKNIYRLRDKEISLWRRHHIGFVFQFYHLIEELNALENVALVLDFPGKESSLKKIEELLQYLGIEDRKTFFPSQLSGGEKQKVAIARALVNDPEIVLCDEPTGNLDKESQEKVVDLLERLNKDKGKTIVLVTHNTELARRAGRNAVIKEGRVVQ
ncbi:MAG: ABC transporter ATP-binding protein [Candidatus Omnitrophica bacterium]|jgi:putative ABC transport system ATP-binding protein|nr:ABC transporter ATP-binding protein [Candidatus Omnitrophota bacterium]MDD5430227.1 ABC transporter ATP-binding protein [Candidatus Omnitrophota bacterium]